MNVQATEARRNSGRTFRDTAGEQRKAPKFALATEMISRHRSVVSCVRCVRCGYWVLGLDSRWWSPLHSVFHPQPPIQNPGTCSRKVISETTRWVYEDTNLAICKCRACNTEAAAPCAINASSGCGKLTQQALEHTRAWTVHCIGVP